MAILKIGFISIYPPKGVKHSDSGGVAAYSKNLATSISLDNEDMELVVFGDKLAHKKEEYNEGNLKVIRCWDKGILYPIQILREVSKNRRGLKAFHIQHEYFLYGNIFSAILFPVMLLLLKFLRKPLIVTLHGVISLSKLDDAFMRENNLKGNPHILKLGLSLITKLICHFASRVIVHEGYLARILVEDYSIKQKKIAIIPHGIEKRDDSIAPGKAKEILGLEGKEVVLFFGYIAGYKGLDILIDAFTNLRGENYVLIVAGGEHPRVQKDRKYKDYVHSLKERALNISDRIRFTGFVPEAEIPLIFSAADVVVFPYTTMMSSSGSLSLCIAYGKPFLVSESLKDVIDDGDLLFEGNPESLRNKIQEFFSNNKLIEESREYGETLLEERSWTAVAQESARLYREVLKC